MTTKRCFKCGCEKPIEGFYKHAQMGDGYLNKCIDCTKKDVAEHRQANLERIRAYDRRRASQPHRLAKTKEISARYRKARPERVKAHSLVHAAIAKGVLAKQPCWVCGGKAESHHPDYSRPLDVVWLCSAHHKQAHALVANDPSMKDAA